jgi:hypothetical protein
VLFSLLLLAALYVSRSPRIYYYILGILLPHSQQNQSPRKVILRWVPVRRARTGSRRSFKKDSFKKWGFVTYRCTYQNNSDWDKFIARFVNAVPDDLEFYNGLDLLDTFTPTVLEDPSFEGATVATLREHFNQWAKTSLREEQGVAEDYYACTGRYRFFIMVDQEAMESVLSAPEDDDETGFVRLVYAEWELEVPDEEDIANGDVDEPEEPLEGCTQHDVGWMRLCWRSVELPGFQKMLEWDDWEAYYARPPEIGDIP